MIQQNPQLPLYIQLVEWIEGRINSGEWKPGQRIPSESELCDDFKISRTTVRQALSDLATRGRVIRVKGRGTFVPKFIARKPFDGLMGFTKEVEYLYNKKAYNKVLSLGTILPDEEISQMLGLKMSEAVIRIQRARYIDGIGIAGVDIRYLPLSRFEGLLEEDLEKNSLFSILIKKFNTYPSHAYTEVSGCGCPEELAGILELKPGEPATYFRELLFDQNEIPFDFGNNYYRVDRYTFRVEISDSSQPEKKS